MSSTVKSIPAAAEILVLVLPYAGGATQGARRPLWLSIGLVLLKAILLAWAGFLLG